MNVACAFMSRSPTFRTCPLPYHRHRFVASQGPSRRLETAEAQPRPRQAFDPPMVRCSMMLFKYLHCRSRVRRHSSPAPLISATAFG